MPKISTLCNWIVKNLTRFGIPTAENLLPGLSTERIRELTAPLPFVIPRSVVELYKWSEGLRPQSGVGNEFFPGFGMDSLPEMVEMYKALSNARLSPFSLWRRSMVSGFSKRWHRFLWSLLQKCCHGRWRSCLRRQ